MNANCTVMSYAIPQGFVSSAKRCLSSQFDHNLQVLYFPQLSMRAKLGEPGLVSRLTTHQDQSSSPCSCVGLVPALLISRLALAGVHALCEGYKLLRKREPGLLLFLKQSY